MFSPFLLTAFFLGFSTNFILKPLGCYTGQKGVNYYAEIHTTKQNIVIHVIFMPFTIYGMTQWIPALFGFTDLEHVNLFQQALFFYWLGIYSILNKLSCLYYCFMYYPVVMYGMTTYIPGIVGVIRGVTWSGGALVLQEVLGHKLGGDPASRPEAVFNAILYAKYFSAHSLKRIIQGDL